MKKIKFRGKSMGGHYVYGLLTKKKIRNSKKLSYAIVSGNFKQGETIPVIENSIAQLVGYDKNGAEFYSDDTLIDSGGAEVLAGHLIIHYDEIGSRFYFFRLKESAKNDLQ